MRYILTVRPCQAARRGGILERWVVSADSLDEAIQILASVPIVSGGGPGPFSPDAAEGSMNASVIAEPQPLAQLVEFERRDMTVWRVS